MEYFLCNEIFSAKRNPFPGLGVLLQGGERGIKVKERVSDNHQKNLGGEGVSTLQEFMYLSDKCQTSSPFPKPKRHR
jgi:hypothetical protein